MPIHNSDYIGNAKWKYDKQNYAYNSRPLISICMSRYISFELLLLVSFHITCISLTLTVPNAYLALLSYHASEPVAKVRTLYKYGTDLSLNPQSSSISNARSLRVACVTHFSTTLEANLCCDSCSTLPRTAATSRDRSSPAPCSSTCCTT